MSTFFKKKDSFLERSFTNKIDLNFINKIKKIRTSSIYTKNLNNYKLKIIDKAILDCADSLKNKNVDFKIENNSLEEIKILSENQILEYLFHRYRYEVYPDKKKIDDYPPLIQIEPSSICNFRCVFCFMTDESFSDKSSKHMGVMSLDLYKKIIDDVEGKVQFITLASRGEPLVNKNLNKMLSYSKDKFLIIKINTNASLLNEKNIHDILSNNVSTVVFSADAADKKLYEKLRVRGKFEKIIENIKLFKYIKEKHYKEKKIITRVSGVKFSKDQRFNQLNNFWKEYVDQVAFVEYNPWENSYLKKPNNIQEECSDLWRRMFIWWDGKTNPCDVDYKSNLLVGNAKSESIKDLWNNQTYQNFRKTHLNKKRNSMVPCKSCCVI